ncbi:PqqD family protein [Agromyces sp. ZXT2-6]|uniref:PqqD family protein n=1 Tax=Agromyces sp. ZXT2-6 TaxID=3461153 RepID=UPI004054C000
MSGLRRPNDVGTLELDGVVYAAPLPSGPIVVLEGVAALIWDEACAGDRATITERVAEATDVAPEAIRADVEVFVADLVARGLLE